MKKTILCIIVLTLMLIGASAPAATVDEEQITEALRQADVMQPVQLSRWGDTAACFAETDGAKRLILLEKREGV